MRKLLYTLLLLLLSAGSLYATVGTTVCRLGVAPLLGPCYRIEELMRLSVQHKQVLHIAVRQAGHSPAVADQVVQMLCLGQAKSIVLPDGASLATMAWYGVDSSGSCGVHTLWNPRLALGAPVPCWEIRVIVNTKTIIFVLPKRCGNLARIGVVQRITVIEELPPPIIIVTPPPVLFVAKGAKQHGNEVGSRIFLGATQSSAEIRFYPKPGDVNINGVSSASSSSSASSASNSQNTNINQNNNSAISQSQNVVPVNVVVNTGPGNANGTATGTGTQDAGANQQNNP